MLGKSFCLSFGSKILYVKMVMILEYNENVGSKAKFISNMYIFNDISE